MRRSFKEREACTASELETRAIRVVLSVAMAKKSISQSRDTDALSNVPSHINYANFPRLVPVAEASVSSVGRRAAPKESR